MYARQHGKIGRLLALAALAAVALVGQATVSPGAAHASRASTQCTGTLRGPSRVGRFGGIAHPSYRARCGAAARAVTRGLEAPYEPHTAPPLRYGALYGQTGKVMASSATTPLTLTPIFWAGTSTQGYSFSSSYTSLIQQYVGDVAADSGLTTNEFAALTQYFMTSRTGPKVHYNVAGRDITIGHPLIIKDKIPTTCTVNSGRIYHNDPVGYTSCVADQDIAHEVQNVLGRKGWAADTNNLYAMFLPKHVEVCFERGNPSDQQCTVNRTKSAAFCAYHTFAHTKPQAIYATLPYPVYASPTGYSCSAEYDAPGAQYPNHKPDADVELSSLSHEVSEAITDPKLDSWSARDGNEVADLCSDVYGALQGPAGAEWNQTINGHHYLTQEEFSNKEFVLGKGGCVQDENVPTVTSVSPAGGAPGRTVTVQGTGFRPGRTTVLFAGTPATLVSGRNTTKLTVTAPLGPLGVADVVVKTPNGTSETNSDVVYTLSAPTISSVSAPAGPFGSTITITINGTNFVPRYPTRDVVTFNGTPAPVTTASSTQLVLNVPTPTTPGEIPVVVTTSSEPGFSVDGSYSFTGCRCK